jgi:hypothetical protein
MQDETDRNLAVRPAEAGVESKRASSSFKEVAVSDTATAEEQAARAAQAGVKSEKAQPEGACALEGDLGVQAPMDCWSTAGVPADGDDAARRWRRTAAHAVVERGRAARLGTAGPEWMKIGTVYPAASDLNAALLHGPAAADGSKNEAVRTAGELTRRGGELHRP